MNLFEDDLLESHRDERQRKPSGYFLNSNLG